MSRRVRAVGLVVAPFLAAQIRAQPVNEIRQHNPVYEPPGVYYQLLPGEIVEIIQGIGGETFEFEAVLLDNGQYVGPGIINSIVADANAGDVALTVVGHDGHAYGAEDVGEINLSASGVAGTVQEIKLSGNLGELGPTLATNAGILTIGGDVADNITINQSISGPVTIAGTLRPSNSLFQFIGLSCARLLGDLTVSVVQGTISITDGSVAYTGTIFVTSELHGPSGHALRQIHLSGPLSGTIHVALLEWRGSIRVEQDCSGAILIDHNTMGISTSVVVGGSLSGQIVLANEGIAAGTTVGIGGAVTGTVTTASLYGELNLAGQLAAPGQILVNGDIGGGSGVLTLGPLCVGASPGSVRVQGGLYGLINAPQGLDAHVQVGTVEPDGQVQVGQPSQGGDLKGTVAVTGDLAGSISAFGNLTGAITVGGSLSGKIEVDGTLNDSSQNLSGGHIIVDGSFTSGARLEVTGDLLGDTTFIAMDYDGYDAADRWQSGAVVWVNGVPYYGNTPEKRIWETTECKADPNNDHNIGFDDIDAFVLALTDPQGYALAYPGLGAVSPPWETGGSMVFHGDLNCDGALDFLDIDPFVQRITEGCCEPTCGHCTTNAGAELSPQQLAVELRGHIAPQRYGDLVTLAGTAAHALPDPDRRAYWHAVYVALSK